MAFWIACAEHREIRFHGSDVGHEIAGVVEIADQTFAIDVVASQGEHRAHTGLLEHVEGLVDFRLVGVQRGQVRDCGNAVLLADRVGDARGGGAVRMGAVAVGHGNEVGVQPLQTVKGVIDGVHGSVAFRVKDLKAEHRGMHADFLT